MSLSATEGVDVQATSSSALTLEAWVDRAADVLKTILPQIPQDEPLRGTVVELLDELGADYFTVEGEGAVDEATAAVDQEHEEGPVESPEDKLAFALSALRIFVEHSTATGETQNAMVDLIEKYQEQLPADKVAAAVQWAEQFERAAWPS